MSKSTNSISSRTKHKLVFLGDQNTGKTSIIQRFINDKFDDGTNPTIGIDFLAKNFSYNDNCYRLQLWDTAGQQKFRSLIPGYLKDAICAIFVYDVKNIQSLQNIQKWISLFKQNKTTHAIGVLCANKIDLRKNENLQDGQNFAKENNMPFFKVSAKTGQEINNMFSGIIDAIQSIGKQRTPQHVFQTPRNSDKTYENLPQLSEVRPNDPIKLSNDLSNQKQKQKKQKMKRMCCKN